MRKLFSTLILTLLVATLAPGQPLIKKALLAAPQSYSTVLNGTSQYWSKSNPVNLDLNGAEMIADADDRTFDTTVGHWVDGGTHSITRSTTDKRTGAASGKIVASAAGDAATNFVNLPYANFDTIVEGKKYTIEKWVRGTGIASGTDLASGKTWVNNAGEFEIFTVSTSTITSAKNTTGVGRAFLPLAIAISSGLHYKVTYNLTLNSGVAPFIALNSSASSTDLSNLVALSSGVNTVVLLANATNGSAGLKIAVGPASDFALTITIEAITLPTITAVIGSKSASTASISCVPGIFTRFVFNFQATASEVGQALKLYLNQADTVYIDDNSLTPAYDAIICGITKVNSEQAGNRMVATLGNNTTGANISIYLAPTTATIGLAYSDGVSTTVISAAGSVFYVGNFYYWAILFNRTGNQTIYVNNVAVDADAITANGKLTFEGLALGYKVITGSTVSYLNGFLSQCQFIRFNALPSDIVQTIAYINSTWKRNGLPKAYAGGTVVAHYNWRAQGTDISGNGNHLTPVASPPIIKIQP